MTCGGVNTLIDEKFDKGEKMSFVDDLNMKVDQNELLQAQSKHIKMYVMRIVDAVKQSCLSNKDKHITSGYFGCIPYPLYYLP